MKKMSSEKKVLTKIKDSIVTLDLEGVKKASEDALAAGIRARAKKIGADAAAKDAVEGVRTCTKLAKAK